MKKYSIIIATVAAFLLLSAPANAVLLNTGICGCTFNATSTELPATNDNCASVIRTRTTANECVWTSDACFCRKDYSVLNQSECKSDAQETLSAAFSLSMFPGAQITGTCIWTSTAEEEETPSEEAPPTGAGAPPRLEFEPPLGTTDINEIIGNIIRAITGIIGSIALLMFVAGGFMWMTAAGNEERVKLAKNILIWSTLGLVVIFSAYAVTRYILTALLE